jgi:hypothetical protein
MGYTQCLEHTRCYQCITWLVSFIKLRLKDQFQQAWHSSLENSSKALNYKLFKDIFETDDYLEIAEKFFPLKCVDLGSQIISFLLNQVDGII